MPYTTSQQRKEKSEKKLKNLKVPVLETLPLVEDSKKAKIRSAKDIVKRCLILSILIDSTYSQDYEKAEEWLKQVDLWNEVSPSEKKFLRANHDEKNRIQISWRAESLWTLLWVVSLIDKLELPTKTCDLNSLPKETLDLITNPEEFFEKAKLRDTEEILDETDLIYRTHWAVRDSELNGKEIPGNFNPGVVIERHYALNWVTYYADNWDDVTTDT